jgi:hypothetical protein
MIEPDKKIRADGILVETDKLEVDESIFLREILEDPSAKTHLTKYLEMEEKDEEGNLIKNLG